MNASAATDWTSSSGGGLSVLSLNVWGIFAARAVTTRMGLIRDRIAPFDIVCFQEQFEEEHSAVLMGNNTHPYFHRFPSSPFGSGLAIASKHPILSNTFVPFRHPGKIERIWEGDAIANKGVAISRVLVPRATLKGDRPDKAGQSNVEILVFNTHLVGQYQRYSDLGGYEPECNSGSRLAQAHQLAQLVVAALSPNDSFIICGDINAGFNSPEMDLIKAYLHMHGLPVAEAVEDQPTYTTENLYHSGIKTYLYVMNMMEDMPVQLDHVLFGGRQLRCVRGAVVLNERIFINDDVYQCSDHFGVAGTLVLVEEPVVVGVRQLPPTDSVLPAHLEALRFAADVLGRYEERTRRVIQNLNMLALSAIVLLVALCFAHAAHDRSFGVSSTLLAFALGISVATLFFCGQFHRGYQVIATRYAVDDLKGVLRRTAGGVSDR